MARPLVSVIIPVFNAMPYLCQCLDTVLAQTLREIEIICIDDGSSDGSDKTLETYAARDSRLRVVTQENCGPGIARNRGIQLAMGEYIAFLDADDFFEPAMLEKAYVRANRLGGDVAVFRSDSYLQDEGVFQQTPWTIRTSFLPNKKSFAPSEVEKNLFGAFVSWSWDKIYRTDFVRNERLEFQNLRNDEDLLFVWPALALANRIVIIDEVLAHHRKTAVSLSATRSQFGWSCVYDALCATRGRLLASGVYERFEQDFINASLHCVLRVLYLLEGESFVEFYKRVKTEWAADLNFRDQPDDYFYRKDERQALEAILSLSHVDFLFWRLARKEDEIKRLKTSTTWNAGRFITYLPRKLFRTFWIGRNRGDVR